MTRTRNGGVQRRARKPRRRIFAPMDDHTQTVSHIPVESVTHLPFAQDVVSLNYSISKPVHGISMSIISCRPGFNSRWHSLSAAALSLPNWSLLGREWRTSVLHALPTQNLSRVIRKVVPDIARDLLIGILVRPFGV